MYQVKSNNSPIELKDIDESKRIVKGVFSKTNIEDSDGDVIVSGAFRKSIQERGPASSSIRKVAHLRNHNWDKAIGSLKELYEDADNLIFVSQLGRADEGKNALYDYQDGIIREHSIGFLIPQDKAEMNGDVRMIKEVNLFEGSAVTFGANEFTPVLDVSKSEDAKSHLDLLNSQMTTLIKALAKGLGTDERLYSIEMQLRKLQSQYNSLFEKLLKQPDKTTDETEKKSIKTDVSQFFNLLK